MPDVLDDAGRTEQPERALAAHQDPQQLVEADEVVDVGVGDEYVAEPQQLARAQGVQVAEVEQHGAAFEHAVDVERRIAEAAVDQMRVEQRRHLDRVFYRLVPRARISRARSSTRGAVAAARPPVTPP